MATNHPTFTPEELQTETWKPTPEYLAYEASTLGRIRRATPGINTRRGRILNAFVHARYFVVRLRKAPKVYKMVAVHRLVASAFFGARPKGLQVNHIDGNKLNNRIENLEWVTPAENARHAMLTGLMTAGDSHYSRTNPEKLARGDRNGARTRPDRVRKGELNGMTKITEDAAREVKRLLKTGIKQRAIARAVGITESHVSQIKHGKSWKHVN